MSIMPTLPGIINSFEQFPLKVAFMLFIMLNTIDEQVINYAMQARLCSSVLIIPGFFGT